MNYATLKSLLMANATALSGMTVDQIATWCNTANSAFTQNVLVALSDIEAYFIEIGIYGTMQADGENTAATNHAIAYQSVQLLSGPLLDIDASLSATQSWLAGLVSAGYLTATQQADVIAMGTKTLTPAESVGLSYIEAGDVIAAQQL